MTFRIASIILIAAALSGCGQTGPLYLPNQLPAGYIAAPPTRAQELAQQPRPVPPPPVTHKKTKKVKRKKS